MTPREAIAEAWCAVPGNEVIDCDELAEYFLRSLRAAGYAVVPRQITPAIAGRLEGGIGHDSTWVDQKALVDFWRPIWEWVVSEAEGNRE